MFKWLRRAGIVAGCVAIAAGYLAYTHYTDKACNPELLWTRASGLSSVESGHLRLTVGSGGETITATPIGSHARQLQINLFNLYPTADTGGFAHKQQISPRVRPGDPVTIALPAGTQAVGVSGALC